MVVIVENKQIQFPTTDGAQKRFVRLLESGAAQNSTKKKGTGKTVRSAQKKKSRKRKTR
jgi:hypothetical protein